MSSRRFNPVLVLAVALVCAVGALPLNARIVAYGVPSVQAQEGVPVQTYLAYFTTTRPNTDPAEINTSIEWGDGSVSPGIVTKDETGRFWVFGKHAYSESGTYKVRIKIFDPVTGYGTGVIRPGTR